MICSVGQWQRLGVDLGAADDDDLAGQHRGLGERVDERCATSTPSADQVGSRVSTMVVRPGSGRPIDS